MVGPEEERTQAANIFDVARLAGVSHQTVSRVINNQPNVRPATRARVKKAIAQLNYSPSPAARALVTRRSRTIGLIVPAVSDYGPTSTAIHFNVAARAARYSVDTVSAVDVDPDSLRALVEGMLRQRVDAIVLIVNDVAALEAVDTLDLNIPLVAAAATAKRSPRIVSIDQYRGARSAVRHLAEAGHTRIAHVAGPTRAPDTVERLRGWRDELEARRLEVPDPLYGEWTAASGYTLGLELGIKPGDAVFAGNDHMAIGLLSALRERDIRVPDDVSVVGFDDVPEAGYLFPPLTTVRQDFAALGERVMQKVLISVEEPDRVTEDTPLATRLIVRRSTTTAERPEVSQITPPSTARRA